jgi:hypothetical protein
VKLWLELRLRLGLRLQLGIKKIRYKELGLESYGRSGGYDLAVKI